MSDSPFNITRDELLNLAAQKLADEHSNAEDLSELARSIIKDRTETAFKTQLTKRIDEFLAGEMEKLLSADIVPIDIWGNSTGKATTIRAQLALRAKDFWEVKVNADGKPESWGGTPRHEWLLKRVAQEEFVKAIKANIDSIVGGFKAALKADAAKLTAEHIDKLISIKGV